VALLDDRSNACAISHTAHPDPMRLSGSPLEGALRDT
jgi:hypothetical protein